MRPAHIVNMVLETGLNQPPPETIAYFVVILMQAKGIRSAEFER